MNEVNNRSALYILPKEQFKKWAALYNDESVEVLDARLKEKHIYLIEYSFKEEGLSSILEAYYIEIFENELADWNFLKHEWPKDRNINVFLDWFEVTLCDVIYDFKSGKITTEKV